MGLLSKLFTRSKKTKPKKKLSTMPSKVKLKKAPAKKKPSKKLLTNPAAKKALKKTAKKEKLVGLVTHYFPKVKAAVVKIKADSISLGDTLHIKGHTTDFIQKVASIQVDNQPIKSAKKGKEIGLKVKSRVRHNDSVYK